MRPSLVHRLSGSSCGIVPLTASRRRPLNANRRSLAAVDEEIRRFEAGASESVAHVGSLLREFGTSCGIPPNNSRALVAGEAGQEEMRRDSAPNHSVAAPCTRKSWVLIRCRRRGAPLPGYRAVFYDKGPARLLARLEDSSPLR